MSGNASPLPAQIPPLLFSPTSPSAKLPSAARFHEASFAGANLKDTSLGNADLRNAQGLKPDQVKAADSWELAHYSPEFRATLGLPPEDQTSASPQSAPTP